ncbi:MAG: class B sortase [Oscillospiraceae bacterium]|nr:class B sortase [Oscillospiraceae bacterium]
MIQMAEMDMGLAPSPRKKRKKKKQSFWKSIRLGLIPVKGDSVSEIVRKLVFLSALVILVVALVLIGVYVAQFVALELNAAIDENGNRTATDAHLFEVKNRTPTAQEIEQLPEGSINEEYAALYAENSDFVGWITIPGTNIDYPVVQTTDNDYYLHKAFDKTWLFEGTIFADYRGPITSGGMPHNTVIYGHNMLYKYQFTALTNYKKDISFLRMSPIIDFNTLYGDGKYKVFAVFVVNWEDKYGDVFDYTGNTYFHNQAEFYDYVLECGDRSIYDTGVDVEYGDEFLTLSTCEASTYMDLRLVVVARKVRENEAPIVDTSKIVRKSSIKYFKGYYQIYGNLWKGRTWDTSVIKGLDAYIKEHGLEDDPSDYQ